NPRLRPRSAVGALQRLNVSHDRTGDGLGSLSLLDASDRLDDDIFDWNSVRLVSSALRFQCAFSGANVLDFVDSIHSLDDFAEDAISDAVFRFGPVQSRIVYDIDVKLAGSGVRRGLAGHRNRSTRIADAIRRFVLDGRLRRFFFFIGRKSA